MRAGIGGLGRLRGLPGRMRGMGSSAPWRRFGQRAEGLKKAITTVVLLLVIYYAVTSLVAYITAPRIEMTMSPIAGRIAVAAQPAKVEPVQKVVTYTASIAPFREVTVYPRVEGWVHQFDLYEGGTVRKGQLIARLDRAELGAATEQAKAHVAQAEANLARAKVELPKAAEERAQAEAGLAESKAALLQARAELQYITAEYRRDEILVKGGAIAQAAFDSRHAQFQVSRERIAAAEARVRQMEAAIARAKARQEEAVQMVRQAEAALAASREELQRRSVVLGYTDVEAPISGRVSKRHIYAGILVKPGMPIVDIQQLDSVRIQAKVAEPDMPFIRPGTEALVRFPALPAGRNEFRIKVTTVFPQLDPTSRTATVEMVLPNPGELIKPDMYAIVDLVLQRKEKAITIPRESIIESDGKPTVYVTDAVTAMSRPVKLGLPSGNRVEVLEGVKEGEMVIFKGMRALADGAQVNVVAGL